MKKFLALAFILSMGVVAGCESKKEAPKANTAPTGGESTAVDDKTPSNAADPNSEP
jgi:hypothetical protein